MENKEAKKEVKKQIIDTTDLSKEAIQILKANDTIRTLDIKGKDYAEVNQRVKAFRLVHPLGKIETNIVSLNNGLVLMKASVYDKEGNLLANGYAYEREETSLVNKTSFIENCETSAVGRALGMCGYGIDTSLASYEEVQTAIEKQDKIVADEKKKAEANKPNTNNNQVKNKFGEIWNLTEKGKLMTMKAVNEKLTEIRGSHCNIDELTDEEYAELLSYVKAEIDLIKQTQTQQELKANKEKQTQQETKPESKKPTQDFSYNDIDFDTTPTDEEIAQFREELGW